MGGTNHCSRKQEGMTACENKRVGQSSPRVRFDAEEVELLVQFATLRLLSLGVGAAAKVHGVLRELDLIPEEDIPKVDIPPPSSSRRQAAGAGALSSFQRTTNC